MNKLNHSHHNLQGESAQTLSEYSVLVGLIAIVVAAVVPLVGHAVGALYQGVTGLFGG